MPRHSPRTLQGRVLPWLRPLALSSLALGSLLVAAPAHAVEPEEGDVAATILDVTIQDGALTARILWSGSEKSLPGEVEVVSYDGREQDTASTTVTPKAGEESEVKLFGAVQEPWETGWAQTLMLKDPDGNVLALQPYDVTLVCDDQDECGLAAKPGVAATRGVLHLSSELDETLARLEQEYEGQEFDVVEAVTKSAPALRGQILGYTWDLWRLYGIRPCACNWQVANVRDPVLRGAKHDLSVPFLRRNRQSAEGRSRISLTSRCQTLDVSQFKEVGIHQLDGVRKPMPFPLPTVRPCSAPCSTTFHHLGRVSGVTTTQPTSGPGQILNAMAWERARYSVNGSATMLLDETASDSSSFDEEATAIRTGATGSGTIQTSGDAWVIPPTVPSPPVPTATVQNGYALGIHGAMQCIGGAGASGTWDTDTTQGLVQRNSLRQSLHDFFEPFGMDVY